MKNAETESESKIARFAARVVAGDIPKAQLLAELEVLNKALSTGHGRAGRPAGAKTIAATSGVKIARAFFYCEALGYSPTPAAKAVVQLFDRDQSAVFAASTRHAARVIKEVADYLSSDSSLESSGFAISNPEAYRVIVSAIKGFSPTTMNDRKQVRELARISMRMVRYLISVDENENAKASDSV